MPKKSGGYRIRLPRKTKSIIPQPFKNILYRKPEPPPWMTPPADFVGSLAEWAVWWALTQLGEEFQFQDPIGGGRQQLGGLVADFFILSRFLIIRVQGIYFHYERGPLTISYDQLQKEQLESKGYFVVDIDEDDALREPLYYVKEALEYRDHSRTTESI